MTDWDKKMADLPELTAWDDRLTFRPPEVLDRMRNADGLGEVPAETIRAGEFAHLKDVKFDLGKLNLTDRQLMAVSLVFYGGVAKARAARAMKISPQSISEHLTAALKKIQKAVG